MGEGLREVRIIAHLKKHGDKIEQDEPLFAMETDKANVEVEATHSGVLDAWLAEEGETVAVGAPIARLTTSAASSAVTRRIPPRSRALCRELQIADELISQIPSATGTLTEDDILRYIEQKDKPAKPAPSKLALAQEYVDSELTPSQRIFITRARQDRDNGPILAVVKRTLDWGAVEKAREKARSIPGGAQVTRFQLIAFAAARAAASHPKFRSILIGSSRVRQFDHINLGFAVALRNDELTTAVVKQADTLDLPAFREATNDSMRRARHGEDQMSEPVPLLLSSMIGAGVTDAIPVLVSPAIAILFIGDTYPQNGGLMVNLVLGFDHRLINGLGAAKFLGSICDSFERDTAEIAAHGSDRA
ncbi:dihydrolipoamide acetyltransferase component of pyruvate dehydrogenase complex [Capsulimonas corticalis]|uniref:Dihydrolipoamide acetyltransferase component of pyruvate dehydrogenase complex n=2 Tax=Capsulimonas corticalis TaxID=2219043 RepID=A0A402CQV1_9BACT|nr:dihydrolipoamide acetyltransferase component of pyruvate dehydrogenase complex [Capsulimonas corticalis]